MIPTGLTVRGFVLRKIAGRFDACRRLAGHACTLQLFSPSILGAALAFAAVVLPLLFGLALHLGALWYDARHGTSYMTAGSAITAAGNGDWSSATVNAPWPLGVKPVAGDTVTIGKNLTVTSAEVAGHSPGAGDPTAAILVQSPGSLVVTGGNLSCRGDLTMNNAPVTMTGPFVFEFDASHAATPSTALYTVNCVFPIQGSTVTLTGTSGNRGTFRSNAGGGNGRFYFPDNGNILIDYVDLVRVGDATHPAITCYVPSAKHLHLQEVTLDANCGVIGDAFGSASHSASIQELINVTHRGTASVGLPSDVLTTGTRTISGCCFAGSFTLARCDGFNVTNTMIEGALSFTGGPWTSWDQNLVVIPAANPGDYEARGPVTNGFTLRPGNPNNGHGWTILAMTGSITGNIFDMPDGTFANGDWITSQNVTNNVTISGNLVLFTESGVPSGTLLTGGGGATLNWTFEHNVYASGGALPVGANIGESYTGHTDMLKFGRSNLAWHPTSGAIIIYGNAGVVQDIILSANANHNGVWNPAANPYPSLTFSSGTPGANDVSGNPGFVDSSRNFKKFGASIGTDGTITGTLTEMRKKNDGAGFNTSATISGLRTYVLGGFKFTNAAFHNTGHDGTDIGIQGQYQAPAVGSHRHRIGHGIGLSIDC